MKKMIVCAVIAGLFTGVASAKELTKSQEDAAIAVPTIVIGGALVTAPLWGTALYNKHEYGTYLKPNGNLFGDGFIKFKKVDLDNEELKDIPVIDPSKYNVLLGDGYYGEAFLDSSSNRVLKNFFDYVKFSDKNLKREVRVFNEMQLELGHNKFATARVVKDDTGKLYMETPYIDGRKPTSEELEDLEAFLEQKGFTIGDLQGVGNVKVINDKPFVVDAGERVKYTRTPSLKSYKYMRGLNITSEHNTKLIINNEKNELRKLKQISEQKLNDEKSQIIDEQAEEASSGEILRNPMDSENSLLANEQMSEMVNANASNEIKSNIHDNDEDNYTDKAELGDDDDRGLEDDIKEFKPIE